MDLSQVYAQYQAEEERTRQRNIVDAREYYEGEHPVYLTERQKEFLAHDLTKQRFALNYCATIVDAAAEKMLVKGFQTADEALGAWAWDVWQANRMDGKQIQVHRECINEGEHFVLVDWPEGREFPRFLPHPRYTDPEFGGTGFGCKAHYANDDPNQDLEAVSKRWTETYQDERGRTRQRSRMNIYYPDRIERYVRSFEGIYRDAGWAPFTESEDEDAAMAWVGADGAGLGIPFGHFIKPGRLELWDAIPLQDLINKTALDIIATVDAAGFPIRLTYGFPATTDGKEPESDGGNAIKLFPGCWMYVPLGADGNNRVEFKGGEDPRPMLETLDSYIQKLAQVTDTPLGRFQMTRQIAAEGTLKQQEAPLLAKVRAYTTQVGNGWEDTLRAAVRLANARGVGLSDQHIETLWEPAESRDDTEEMERLRIKAELGVPREKLWEEMGYDPDEIAQMRAMASEEQAAQSNLGGALLEAFERGV